MSDEAYRDRLVDEAALADFLAATLGGDRELRVTYHEAGHSNETLFVDWGDRELVLRRPPAGEHADAAHDVLREYHALDALQGAVPVPETVAACEDETVLGSDFYLMERLEGDIIRETEPDRFGTPARRRRLSERLVDGLVAVHEVDPGAVGLDGLGHPEGFTERQVERWTGQLKWATEVTAAERDLPDLWAVADWLAEHAPTDHDHTLVHGDYKLDNLLWAPDAEPTVAGVLDWEMCTRGDPLTDLGWLLTAWADPGDPERADPLSGGVETREGYLSRRELLDRYEAQTGRTYRHDRFYRGFGAFKSAVACEMMYRRYVEGNSTDPTYPLMAERVPRMAAHARAVVEGEAPL